MMKKIAMALGICALLACGAASAANGQVVSKAKSACQNNPTQCSQAKSTAKADAQKEAKAAKDACAKNQAACDNAKTTAKNGSSIQRVDHVVESLFLSSVSDG
ncbi:late histone H1 [Salmonella enterica]